MSINKPNSLPITKLGVYLRLSAMILGQSYELALDKYIVVLSQIDNVLKALMPTFIQYIFFLPQYQDAEQIPKDKRCNL